MLHYAVMLIGLTVALQMIGVSLAALFAAGAFVAVGVGFALQGVLQSFVSGVILLAERSIKERDVLEVDGEMIRVELRTSHSPATHPGAGALMIGVPRLFAHRTDCGTGAAPMIFRLPPRLFPPHSALRASR